MSSAKAQVRRLSTAAIAVLFTCAVVLPILISRRTYAAQLTERQIDISTSEVSATDVTYTVSFKPATSITAQGIVIDFCDSPLVGTACDNTTNTAGFSTNEAGPLAVTATGLTLNAATDTTTVVLTGSATLTAGTTYTITLGSVGGADGITNPSFNGSFYGRILTYTNSATAAAYAPATPGAYTDAGGVAMSTANQLTVSARVQEVLVFCVGTTDTDPTNATDGDCADISGTVVDLGVVQSGSPNISPVTAVNGGNDRNGLAMVRTNAVNGVVIDYFAEPVTGDSGATHLGALRVSGATCAGDGTIATGAKTDQCFNSSSSTRTAFATVDEGFGMTSSSVNVSNGTTSNLVRDVEYCGAGTNAAATGGACTLPSTTLGGGWAWAQTTPDTIASSGGSATKVVDDEMLVLRFAAQAAVTTPTGQYGVTSTYVATSSF